MPKTKFTVDLRDIDAKRLADAEYEEETSEGALRLAVTEHLTNGKGQLHHALVSRAQQAGSDFYYFRYDSYGTPRIVHVGPVVIGPAYPI